MNEILFKCKQLTKADLHLHLNGLFNTETIKNILIEEGTNIPVGFDVNRDLNVLTPKKSLNNYLKPWEVLRLIPKNPNNLVKLIESGFVSLVENNVNYVELRSSLIYLSLLQGKSLTETVGMVLYELKCASQKYNVDFRLIITMPRNELSIIHLSSLISTFIALNRPKEIVGIDLAGDENIVISKDVGRMFKAAKEEYGFKITIHAGETGVVQNIHDAINIFDADRIGHGVAASRSIRTIELLRKKDICVEVCPISNRRTGSLLITEDHPVKTFIDNEVPFVICSDNPGIHTKGLTDDYFEFYKETQRYDILEKMYMLQMKYSFR